MPPSLKNDSPFQNKNSKLDAVKERRDIKETAPASKKLQSDAKRQGQSSSNDEDAYVAPKQENRSKRHEADTVARKERDKRATRNKSGEQLPMLPLPSQKTPNVARTSKEMTPTQSRVLLEHAVADAAAAEDPIAKELLGAAGKRAQEIHATFTASQNPFTGHKQTQRNLEGGQSTPPGPGRVKGKKASLPSPKAALASFPFSPEVRASSVGNQTLQATPPLNYKRTGVGQAEKIRTPPNQRARPAKLVRWTPENCRVHVGRHATEFKSEMATGKTYAEIAEEFFGRPLALGGKKVGLEEKLNKDREKIRFDYATGSMGVLAAEKSNGVRNIKTFFKPKFFETNALAKAIRFYEKQ